MAETEHQGCLVTGSLQCLDRTVSFHLPSPGNKGALCWRRRGCRPGSRRPSGSSGQPAAEELVAAVQVDGLLRGGERAGLDVLLLARCGAEAGVGAGCGQRAHVAREGLVLEACGEGGCLGLCLFFLLGSTVSGVLRLQEAHVGHGRIHAGPPVMPPLLRAVEGRVAAVDVPLVRGLWARLLDPISEGQ
ncbi:hypothetical protein MC885_005301, partial [Smutsia gigantea]